MNAGSRITSGRWREERGGGGEGEGEENTTAIKKQGGEL